MALVLAAVSTATSLPHVLAPQRYLLVVDQAEELLTQSASAERERFAELVCPALSGPMHLVGALRPEFVDQLLSDLGLAGLPTFIYPLRPLRREALCAVIEKPAQQAEIEVDEGLVDDTDSGEALPLLAFTLAELAQGVTRGGRLSGARYDQLGWVQGALIRHAETALAEASRVGDRSREEVISGLLRLVTVEEQGRPTRWRVPRADLPKRVVTELDVFVAHRLLTIDTLNDTVGGPETAFQSPNCSARVLETSSPFTTIATSTTAPGSAARFRERSIAGWSMTAPHGMGCPAAVR